MSTLSVIAAAVRRADMPVRYRIQRLEDLIDNPRRATVMDFLVDVVEHATDPKLKKQAHALLKLVEDRNLDVSAAVGKCWDLYRNEPGMPPRPNR